MDNKKTFQYAITILESCDRRPKTVKSICMEKLIPYYSAQQIVRLLRMSGLIFVKRGTGGGICRVLCDDFSLKSISWYEVYKSLAPRIENKLDMDKFIETKTEYKKRFV